MLKETLDHREDLRKFLFIRGFLMTDHPLSGLDEFPFYGNFNEVQLDGYYFYTHNLQKLSYARNGTATAFIAGHAYNPFTMEHEEEKVLDRILEGFGTDTFIDRVNEITGVFVLGIIDSGKITYFVDPAGMQSACWGIIENHFYISSHPQLIGDICHLEMDGFVNELIHYKWYGRVFGPYLPADLSPFSQVKRIIPSIKYVYGAGKLSHKRIWPLETIKVADDEDDYNKIIEKSGDILKNNMELISRKWNKPYISLTGGIDSNTTFAAANGLYDRFETFSYISAEKEIRDAEAAEKIANAFNVPHHVYNIPETPESLKDYDIKVAIQAHNSGHIAVRKGNESRKRVYLEEHCDCDVEVKSWVSETIRGYFYKHFARKKLPPLSGKFYRNLYKIFIEDRKLAHKIDKIFDSFLDEFEYRKIPEQYPCADIYYNEDMWGSWGGLNISEMKFCFDLTMPFNNRILLDTLFHAPLEKRVSDRHLLDVRKYLNKQLYDMNIRVVNMEETDFRARMLNLILVYNTLLP